MSLPKIPPSARLVLLAAFLLLLFYSKEMVILVLIATGIGVLLSPVLDKLQKYLKVKRAYATLIVVALIVLFLLLLTALFGWIIVEQVNAFAEKAPSFASDFQTKLNNLFERFPWITSEIKNFDFASAIKSSAQSVLSYANNSVFAISGLVFSLIIGIYLAVDRDYYFKGVVRMAKPESRDRFSELLCCSAKVVRTWFKAQLLDMAIIGFLTGVGLWIADVQYWAVFGLLTAVLAIIPYVGILIVVVLATMVTLVSDPQSVPWVWLVFFITQQIEGNLILPWVMKDQAEIPEAVLLVVMLFFGSWFGFLGVFIAPASVAVGIYLFKELYIKNIE